jgi:hypothetical protein
VLANPVVENPIQEAFIVNLSVWNGRGEHAGLLSVLVFELKGKTVIVLIEHLIFLSEVRFAELNVLACIAPPAAGFDGLRGLSPIALLVIRVVGYFPAHFVEGKISIQVDHVKSVCSFLYEFDSKVKELC